MGIISHAIRRQRQREAFQSNKPIKVPLLIINSGKLNDKKSTLALSQSHNASEVKGCIISEP
ncbi:hypothetical protein PROPEN_03727 [Proteus penneri ATCC 35198]|nr:hypothetical protein PROPEN_03727 [Proteus penneri ATCC 35198]